MNSIGVKAVLFDLDDTLLVDEEVSRECFRESAQRAAQAGLDGDRLVKDAKRLARELHQSSELFEHCYSIGISPFECLWGQFRSEGEIWHRLADWAEAFRVEVWRRALAEQGRDDAALATELSSGWAEERRKRQRLLAQAREVVDGLRGRYKLGMLTNGAPALQREKIAWTGLADAFDAIAVSGEVGHGKPRPEVFHWLLERLGAKPEEAVMVGNSIERDIAGAHSAGLRSVLIEFEDPEPNAPHRPDATIRSLEELPAVLEKMAAG